MKSDDWPDIAALLKASLSDGLQSAGTVEQVDVLAHVGKVEVSITIESSDLEGDDQGEAYSVLCDLLATRLNQGVDQVLGCLLFATEPNPRSLASALVGMHRGDANEVFTPVIALSRTQAESMAQAKISIDTVVEAATELIAAATVQASPSKEIAATLLSEIDELIYRHVNR